MTKRAGGCVATAARFACEVCDIYILPLSSEDSPPMSGVSSFVMGLPQWTQVITPSSFIRPQCGQFAIPNHLLLKYRILHASVFAMVSWRDGRLLVLVFVLIGVIIFIYATSL